jgi:hypothetical protein
MSRAPFCGKESQDPSTLPWEGISLEEVFSPFTNSVQDYPPPAEVADGAHTTTEQLQVAVLPPAAAPVQLPASTPSSANTSLGLPVGDMVQVLPGDAEHQAPSQDVVAVQRASGLIHPDDDGATKGTGLLFCSYMYSASHISGTNLLILLLYMPLVGS